MITDRQSVEMKPDSANSETVWTTNSDLLTADECLPVISNNHVSSVLSHLDPTEKNIPNSLEIAQNMEFIMLPNAEYKLTVSHNPQNNFIIVKNKTDKDDIKPKATQDMHYVFCDLCPFICINEKRLNDHMQNFHENTSTIPLSKYKCPACINIFHHKISLRSHLVHDHLVISSDLNKILAMVLKKKDSDKLDFPKNIPRLNNITISCKNEFDLKYGEKLTKLSSEKILNDENVQNSNELITINTLPCVTERNATENNTETSMIVNLPTVEILPNNTEKIFNSYIKKHSSLSKFLDKKIQKCSILSCKVRLQNMEKLNYHIKCHVDTSFQCPECNKTYLFWKTLSGHLWRSHKIDMELYACDKCEYKTFSLGHLNNVHKLTHNDTKPFVCNICLRGFKNSKQLRNHRSLHKQKTDKKHSFTCDICSKLFSDRRQLRIHMDGVHKKIKPFLCNFCGYKGATRSSLRMHMRQHTGEKPFSCDTCSYTTADHNSLRRHKLRHTGEKPYKCIHCDYACIQSSTYKVHLKTKHPGLEKDLLYSCHVCAFRSINKEMFNTHLLSVHKIKRN